MGVLIIDSGRGVRRKQTRADIWVCGEDLAQCIVNSDVKDA